MILVRELYGYYVNPYIVAAGNYGYEGILLKHEYFSQILLENNVEYLYARALLQLLYLKLIRTDILDTWFGQLDYFHIISFLIFKSPNRPSTLITDPYSSRKEDIVNYQ